MVLRKFKEPILCFQIEVFFLILLSLRFFCVHCFPFALLIIIRTTKRLRTHINKASNISKIIYDNCGIMVKSRYDTILNFPKNCLIWGYLQSQTGYLVLIRESSKIGHGKKSLISTLACFLTAIAKV